MTSLLLQSDPFTVVSATNLNAATPASNLSRDVLGLDARFTANTTIILDRGAVTNTFNTIAVVHTDMARAATILVQTATDAAMTTPTTVVPTQATGIVNPVAGRRECFYFTFTASSHRYVRLTFTGSGACDIGRILIGTAVNTLGVRTDAERLFEDMSASFDFKAYTTFDKAPTLLGWKVQFPMMDETFFRQTWQPFMQSVGNSECFLFIPNILQASTIQSDWCYGRVTAKAGAKHQGWNAWVQEMTMRGIYP